MFHYRQMGRNKGNPLHIPSGFFKDIMQHLEKSAALFMIDENEAKGIKQDYLYIY